MHCTTQTETSRNTEPRAVQRSGPAVVARAMVRRQSGVLRLEAAARGRSARALFALGPPARGLARRHQAALAVSDQRAAAHALQRFAEQRPVVGIVVAQKRLVQPPRARALRDRDRALVAAQPAQRVLAAV